MSIKATLSNGTVVEFDDPKHLEMLLASSGGVGGLPTSTKGNSAPVPSTIEQRKIAADAKHPTNTTYIYSSGHLHQRGDVLKYEGTSKKGDADGQLKLRYVTVGRRTNGVIEDIYPKGGYVFFGEEKGLLKRAMLAESAKRDLIVLAFPPSEGSPPSPPNSPLAQGYVDAGAGVPAPPAEPSHFDSFLAYHRSRVRHYTAFADEVSSCNKLVEMSAPRVFQIGDELFLDLLSFQTRAPWDGSPPKKFFDCNWLYEDKITGQKHPLFAGDLCEDVDCFLTIRSSDGENRIRKFYHLTKKKTLILRIYVADEGRPDKDKNVHEGWMVFDPRSSTLRPIPKMRYDQLAQRKKVNA